MEELQPDRDICKEVCACLHSALISGNKDCIYDGDNWHELDFWEHNLSDSDDILEVISPDGFDAEFVVETNYNNQNRYVSGTWFRIIHIITHDSVIFVSEFESEFGISIITNGETRLAIRRNEVLAESGCPLLPRSILADLHTGEYSKYMENISKYERDRDDNMITINLFRQKECFRCGKIMDADEGNWDTVQEADVCEECFDREYYQCDCCKDSFHQEDIISDGCTYICDSCFDDYYVNCGDCGNIIAEDESFYDDEAGDVFCEVCYEDLLDYREASKKSEDKKEEPKDLNT